MELIITTPEQLQLVVSNAIKKALAANATPPPQKPDRCTFDEAIEITGLSKSKLYKLTASNEIPYKRYSNRLIFSRKDLLDWVESQTVDPTDISKVEAALVKSARRKKKGGKQYV